MKNDVQSHSRCLGLQQNTKFEQDTSQAKLMIPIDDVIFS